MRLFGVGGRRDWNSDKVLILSPMGLEEEWWNFEAGGVASVAVPLSFGSTDPSRSNGAMNTMTPRVIHLHWSILHAPNTLCPSRAGSL